MLNLERLRVLEAVATCGSVVGAARDLHVTTSAVSQQLARLEHEMGQRLLERQGRGIRLTEAGVLLADRAGALLGEVERIEACLAEHHGAVTGTVRVAAFATAARGLLPDALRTLGSQYPELTVHLTEQEPHEAIPDLRRGRLDVVVAQEWADEAPAIPDGLSRRQLGDDVLDLAVPATHPLARRRRVRPTDLAELTWISWSAGQICHDWLVRTLSRHGVEPQIAHTASEHSTQLALVAAGLGCAVIPRLGREPAPPTVRFVPLDPPPTRRVVALWRENATARPAIAAVLDTLSTPDRPPTPPLPA
jgi:molybdate transport repressor ModE-like protein